MAPPCAAALFMCALAACGGSAGGAVDAQATGDARPSDAAPGALACNSLAWCTNYSVREYAGVLPAPAGGAIGDGVYRLAYRMFDGAADPDPIPVNAWVVAGDHALNAGLYTVGLGTFRTSGTTLTFTPAEACDRTGASNGPLNVVVTYAYSATADELRLYRTIDTTGETILSVYQKDAGSLCEPVANEPAQPGDSFLCRDASCHCTSRRDDTISVQECGL